MGQYIIIALAIFTAAELLPNIYLYSKMILLDFCAWRICHTYVAWSSICATSSSFSMETCPLSEQVMLYLDSHQQHGIAYSMADKNIVDISVLIREAG